MSRTLRILFVDDEKSLQELLRTELPRMGHEVTVCPDGRTALKTLEHGSFDVAILDLRMPEMNGFEAARVLRETMPQIPILMFTSHDSPAVESKAASVGIRAVFSKYAGITALVAQASALLSLSR